MTRVSALGKWSRKVIRSRLVRTTEWEPCFKNKQKTSKGPTVSASH